MQPRAKRFAGSPGSRFWPKVEKAGPDDCWIWKAAFDTMGYGVFNMGAKKIIHASRAAWILSNGFIEDGLHVCHKCDNTKCVNPAHLFLGTAKDNSDDKLSKNRQVKGSAIHCSKLNAEKVQSIRRAYVVGNTSHGKLAKIFGVAAMTISKIVHRKTWGYLEAAQ